METNDIRNYNEITNTGITPSNKYIEKIIPIKTEEDRDACLRFLTINNNILPLCHGFYNDTYINSVVECSNYLIYFISQTKDVVAFSLVRIQRKNKGKILNILLACAVPNNNKFGKMIANSLYNFAVKYKYPFLYLSPRTPELRRTFIKYGFETIYGIKGVDEVLEKEIDMNLFTINKRGKTLKVKRTVNINYNDDDSQFV
jgi:hypothetical protein